MLLIYRIIINFILIISPFIFVFRFLNKKESIDSFREKIGFFKKKRKKNILWFHGASVGEIRSIIPLLEKYEKIPSINQILITSNTLSSINIIKKIKLKKVVHQFFPIDTNYLSQKFINYWRPTKVFFIDSEIWPNMIFNLKKRNISINIINARITKKSYTKWKIFSKTSRKIFSSIDLCLASSNESKKLFKNLGVKNVKFFGNLKFTQTGSEKLNLNKNIEKFLKKKELWCASSTHKKEEFICGQVHKILKKKYKNLLTVIIPRHVERSDEIKKELENLDLKVHLEHPLKEIQNNTDILLVNSYGKTKFYFNKINNIFMGGSLVNHGGQNPLEAAILGCNISHGPNIANFKEIYNFLKVNKIAHKINSKSQLIKKINFFIKFKTSQNSKKKLITLGKKILKNTFNEIY